MCGPRYILQIYQYSNLNVPIIVIQGEPLSHERPTMPSMMDRELAGGSGVREEYEEKEGEPSGKLSPNSLWPDFHLK